MSFKTLRELVSLASDVAHGHGIFGSDFDAFAEVSEEDVRTDLDIPTASDQSESTEHDQWWR